MRVESLVEFGNVWVIQLFHDLNLSFDSFTPIWLQQLKLLIYFACNLLFSLFVQAQSDNCISTLTDSFSNKIIIEVFRGAAFSTKLG